MIPFPNSPSFQHLNDDFQLGIDDPIEPGSSISQRSPFGTDSESVYTGISSRPISSGNAALLSGFRHQSPREYLWITNDVESDEADAIRSVQ
jgi:hypothetical protein